MALWQQQRICSCSPTHLKKSFFNLKHKLRHKLTIRAALVLDICLITDKYVCTVKDVENSFKKSIKQLRLVRMLWWNIRGRIKRRGFFPQRRYNYVQMRGEQVVGMSTFRFFCERTFRFFCPLEEKNVFRFVFVFEFKEKQRFVYCLLIKSFFLFLNVSLSFIV